MKYPTKRLIIWRSQVQALAGPLKGEALIARQKAVDAFPFLFFICVLVEKKPS